MRRARDGPGSGAALARAARPRAARAPRRSGAPRGAGPRRGSGASGARPARSRISNCGSVGRPDRPPAFGDFDVVPRISPQVQTHGLPARGSHGVRELSVTQMFRLCDFAVDSRVHPIRCRRARHLAPARLDPRGRGRPRRGPSPRARDGGAVAAAGPRRRDARIFLLTGERVPRRHASGRRPRGGAGHGRARGLRRPGAVRRRRRRWRSRRDGPMRRPARHVPAAGGGERAPGQPRARRVRARRPGAGARRPSPRRAPRRGSLRLRGPGPLPRPAGRRSAARRRAARCPASARRAAPAGRCAGRPRCAPPRAAHRRPRPAAAPALGAAPTPAARPAPALGAAPAHAGAAGAADPAPWPVWIGAAAVLLGAGGSGTVALRRRRAAQRASPASASATV